MARTIGVYINADDIKKSSLCSDLEAAVKAEELREEMLEKVWGTDFEGESRTLDMHIKTLRQKLQEAGNVIKTVRNVGYIFDV